jgi:hypothetical protein
MKLRTLFVLIFAFTQISCSTVLLVRNPNSRVFTDATYTSTRSFFFWGLVGGTQHVYVDQICLGKEVDQVTTEYRDTDVLWGILTVGIYSPRTVKVWCQL